MKSAISLIVLLFVVLGFCRAQSSSSDAGPTFVYALVPNGFDANNYTFEIINLANSAVTVSPNFTTPNGDNDFDWNFYGFISATSNSFVGFASSDSISGEFSLVSYKFGDSALSYVSTFTPSTYGDQNESFGQPIQSIGSTVYLTGNSNDANVTVFSFDFYTKTYNIYPTAYSSYPGTTANGALDPLTGNYYIIYYDESFNHNILVYNINSNKVISNTVVDPSTIFHGNLLLSWINNQLYLIDSEDGPETTLYLVDSTLTQVKEVTRIENEAVETSGVFPFLVSQNQEYLIFIVSNDWDEQAFDPFSLQDGKYIGGCNIGSISSNAHYYTI